MLSIRMHFNFLVTQFMLGILLTLPTNLYAGLKPIQINYINDTYHLNKDNKKSKVENIGLLTLSREYTQKNYQLHTSLALNHSTGSPSKYLNDIQIASNIDTEGGEGVKLYQVYFSYFLEEIEMRSGLIDLSLELNITSSSLSLINSSFGTAADYGAAGRLGPSIYPIPSWGVITKYINKNAYIFLAATDPISDHQHDTSDVITDVKFDKNHHNLNLEVGIINRWFKKLGLGIWKLKDIGDTQEFDVKGSYLIMDKEIGKDSIFIRVSRSGQSPGKMYQNIVFGHVHNKVLNSESSIHLGYSQAHISNSSLNEKVLEALYMYPIDKFTTSISFQEIRNLGGTPINANALTLRLNIQLN